MSSVRRDYGPPSEVAVIGAGMVGLSTGWFLQDAGVHVTVYERAHEGAAASLFTCDTERHDHEYRQPYG